MDWNEVDKLIGEHRIVITIPNEGEIEAAKAVKDENWRLAAACMMMASACSIGHKRSQWYEEQAEKFLEKANYPKGDANCRQGLED